MKSSIKIEIEHDDDGIHCGKCKRQEPMFCTQGCGLFKSVDDITNLPTNSPTVLKPDTPLNGECTPTYIRCQACVDATARNQTRTESTDLDFLEELIEMRNNLAKKQQGIDSEIEKIMMENLWDLYLD